MIVVYVTRAPQHWRHGEPRVWFWLPEHSTCWHLTRLRRATRPAMQRELMSQVGMFTGLPGKTRKTNRAHLSAIMERHDLSLVEVAQPPGPFDHPAVPREP